MEDAKADEVCPRVQALARLAVRVSAIDTLEDLLDAVVEVAAASLATDSVHIGRLDRPSGRLQMLRNAGQRADWEAESPADESYLIADHPQLLRTTEHARAWRGNVDDVDIAENDRAMLVRRGKEHALGVPVLAGGTVWGQLLVTRVRSQPFSRIDQDLAVIVAGLATTGLGHVLGDQRLRVLAYTDPLTGLANRRAADEQLEAWARDPVVAAQLMVTLCDVNGLKTVNDTHGHVVGDRLLREAAGHVSAAARRLPHGLAARVGGDEFLIASPGPDRALVDSVVAELTEAASRLPYGGGLSCGTARAGDLVRPEASPQSLVRSLLRIADSEQYRRKIAGRRPLTVQSPDGPDETAGASRPAPGRARRDAPVVAAHPATPVNPLTLGDPRAAPPHPDEVAGWAADLEDITTVEERLAHAAHLVCEMASAVAWWVSAVDTTGQRIHAVSFGVTRVEGVTDGLWPTAELDPAVYQLADFPTTAQAVHQGTAFYVDTLSGDQAERQLLIQFGFQSMLAAGGAGDDGRRWLVEIYGDSLSSNLHELTTTLHAATQAAIGNRPVPRPATRQ